jgi:hypothetical protein
VRKILAAPTNEMDRSKFYLKILNLAIETSSVKCWDKIRFLIIDGGLE